MGKKQEAQEERDYALAKLREYLKPGTTVYTSLEHASASGMSRSIGLHIVHRGELLNITYWAARATGNTIDQKHGGIKVGGCGMDMGFHVVYSLGRAMWRDGFRCAGAKCGSNDHVNPRRRVHSGDPDWIEDGRAYTDQPGYLGPMPRDGKSKHRGDGGYALNQRWL